MKRILFSGITCLLLLGSVVAQNSKSWTDWSKKDVDKVLNNSPWAQTFKMGETPPDTSSRNGSSGNQSMGMQGPPPMPTEVYVRVRFVTAKPIREAFANRILKSQSDPSAAIVGQLQKVVDAGFGDVVVVAVNVDGPNPRTVGATLQTLTKFKTVELEEKVYLERKDGKRLPLVEYRAPVADDMGGKFVFARSLDGEPFLTPDSDSVRFVLNLSGNLKLNVKFNTKKMLYDEKLEY